jgi:hypothetical protein
MSPTLAVLDLGAPEMVFVLAFLVVLGFWVAMLAHAIRNRRLSVTARILWAIAIAVFYPLAAIIYFLVVVLSRKSRVTSSRYGRLSF